MKVIRIAKEPPLQKLAMKSTVLIGRCALRKVQVEPV
jgi:hypothetical protein